MSNTTKLSLAILAFVVLVSLSYAVIMNCSECECSGVVQNNTAITYDEYKVGGEDVVRFYDEDAGVVCYMTKYDASLSCVFVGGTKDETIR